MTRRQLLRWGAIGVASNVALLAGCGIPPARKSEFHLSELSDQYVEEEEILAIYDAALTTTPAFNDTLSTIRQHHQNHLTALEARIKNGVKQKKPKTRQTESIIGNQTQILEKLSKEEQQLRLRTTQRCTAITIDNKRGTDAIFLLGSIAAASATYTVALEALGQQDYKTTDIPFKKLDGKTRKPISALQTALAAEHAAIYAYGLIGAYLAGTQRTQARESEAVHRRRRDLLVESLYKRDTEPVAAHPAYELPIEVKNQTTAIQLAARIENDLTGPWLAILGVVQGSNREFVLQILTDSAIQATSWKLINNSAKAVTLDFPGF